MREYFRSERFERVWRTLLQAVLGVIAAEVADLSYAWAPVIAAAISFAMAELGKRTGDPANGSFRRDPVWDE